MQPHFSCVCVCVCVCVWRGGEQLQNSRFDVSFTAVMASLFYLSTLFVRPVGWFVVLTYSIQPTADNVADSRTSALFFQAADTP